ncbi:MAG: radical SAM protein, partial [Elusimicrobia bacterium RIFOXYA12_FULL_57_11]
MKNMPLNRKDYYRLPWSVSDNVFSWLEPTRECNIYCEGCFSVNARGSHKTIDQVREELDVFAKYRKSYAVCIAGGEPLTHPQITDIVRLVASRGYKPMLNTNALALTEDVLRKLKTAGLKKLTLHVDSRQRRPGWTGKSEIELNELRLSLARMAARVGGIYCSFNTTVYADTLKFVPDLLKWAQENINIVHGVNFVLFRAAGPKGIFDYYANGKKVELPGMVYRTPEGTRADISSIEVVEAIRKNFPDFEPCAYLSSVVAPDAFKWLITVRVGTRDAIYGYMGPKLMELTQELYHFFTGRYLGPVGAATHRKARRLF